MNANDVSRQLAAITSQEMMAERAEELTSQWTASGLAVDSVEPILRFMESHPQWNFGMPGPLVHFVERFYRRGYEQKLVESVATKPTYHTVWMMNRLINGEKEQAKRQEYIDVLAGVSKNQDADAATVERARLFLSLHVE
jgi:hypothetical protein